MYGLRETPKRLLIQHIERLFNIHLWNRRFGPIRIPNPFCIDLISESSMALGRLFTWPRKACTPWKYIQYGLPKSLLFGCVISGYCHVQALASGSCTIAPVFHVFPMACTALVGYYLNRKQTITQISAFRPPRWWCLCCVFIWSTTMALNMSFFSHFEFSWSKKLDGTSIWNWD